MKTLSLNGKWDYRIGKGTWQEMTVPFSKLAVGHSECRRTFDIIDTDDVVLLKFDGITYHAKVFLNGKFLGDMLPYSEYDFDITNILLPKGNQLTVELEDISPAFGPTAGWENFGGIIRDVYITCLPKNHITDVFAHYTLQNGYTSAELTVETKCTLPENSEFEINLFDGEKNILSYVQKSTETLTVNIEDIKLWSVQTPNLCELKVFLKENGRIIDEYTCMIGFRELKCDRHRFILNGEPIFLKGVCKHETVADSGHCPTLDEIESDLTKIKETGCNFVRLVHYPHNKKTLEIADRIGLLVSEEPGFWWSDTSDPEVASGSLEVLKRTILRDRNHPCVAFWLCFNECKFTEKFLIDSCAVCRKYDPTRMVSGANCMSDEDTKKYYNICGFDFYTMHPYAPNFERAENSAKYLNDKPLLFTEWGGYFVYDNPHLLTDFLCGMNRLYLANSDNGALAGAFFWFWAELNDYNRGRSACIDGKLSEGLVTSDRKPTIIYDAFCKGIKNIGKYEKYDEFWFDGNTDILLSANNFLPDNKTADFSEYFADIAKSELKKPSMRQRRLTHGSVLENIPPLCEIPFILKDGTNVTLDCISNAARINIYGLTSLIKGYPLGGEYGEVAAEITFCFENSIEQTIPLRNGIEITTAFSLLASSRINPIAENSTRTAMFGYDKNFEQYVLNQLTVEFKNNSKLCKIKLKSSNKGYDVLLYGITD